MYTYKIKLDKNKTMKEIICKLICKITTGKVCLGWCKACCK